MAEYTGQEIALIILSVLVAISFLAVMIAAFPTCLRKLLIWMDIRFGLAGCYKGLPSTTGSQEETALTQPLPSSIDTDKDNSAFVVE